MRIGIDVRSAQTASAGRGVGRYVFDLVDSLLRYAPDHTYVLVKRKESSLPPEYDRFAGKVELCETPGSFWHDFRPPLALRLPRLKHNVALQGRYYARLRTNNRIALERAVNGAGLDAMHFPVVPDLNSFPTGRFNCPVIRTFADATCLNMKEAYYDQWHPAMREHYDEQMSSMREAMFATAYSDASRTDAIRFARVEPDRIRTVYCAVADDWRPAYNDAARKVCLERFGIESEYFVFCSTNDPNKNLIALIQAFALLRRNLPERRPMLVLVTPDRDENLLPILKEAWRLGLSRRELVVTGRTTDEELRVLFSEAVALVCPSLYEGFGLPVAEALCLGTPVAVSDASSLPEVAGEAGLYFDPRSIESIARTLERMLVDESLRRTLAERAKAQGRRFSFERQAREMVSVYEEAARAR